MLKENSDMHRPTVVQTFVALLFCSTSACGPSAVTQPAPTFAPLLSPTQTPALGIGSTQVSGKDGIVEVYVPAGEFTMGYNDSSYPGERPAHKVTLDPFWIDRTDVTNAMYALCRKAGACQPPSSTGSATHSNYYGASQYDNYPVINVNWNDAIAYCGWAGRRLPSEAEWEKAARGPDGRIYPWGNAAPDANLLNSDSKVGDTTEVGKYSGGVSPYGALDMAGNVWQWVNDWFDENYYANSPADNPLGPSSGQHRVLRGGTWSIYADFARSAFRSDFMPSSSSNNIGFRCAASP
jgi:formylglycine-generating enzyme required for sulfatase activity